MEDKLLKLSGKKNETIIKILRKISEEDHSYSLEYLAGYISVSTRTIQRYVTILEGYIEAYRQEKRAEFELIQTSRGIRLFIDTNANVTFLISYFLQKDETIQLLVSLLLQEYSSESDYSRNNYLGVHSVNKSIEILAPFLNEFNLKIDKKKFIIIGSEVTIRFFMQNIFWLIYRCDTFPSKFKILEMEKIKGDIDYLIENLNISSNNPVDEKNLILSVSISLLRYQKNCFVQLHNEQKTNVPIYQNPFGNPTLYETTEAILTNHNVYDSEEVYFLILSFLNNRLLYTSKSVKKQLLSHHRRNNTMVLKATYVFLDEFQEKICEIPQDKMAKSFEFIFRSHLTAFIDTNHSNDYNYYIFDRVGDQSPEYIYKLESIIDNLREKEQLALFNKKNYLLNRYMMLNYFLKLKLFYKKPIKIKLYLDFPDVYEDFIKDYLSSKFINDYKLLFIDNDNYQSYDLILTSYLMKETTDKTITISYPLTNREINTLTSKFDELNR